MNKYTTECAIDQGPIQLLTVLRLRAMECHMPYPYGITHCYLSPDTSEQQTQKKNMLIKIT